MLTSVKTQSTSVNSDEQRIKIGDLAYERQRLRTMAHQYVLTRFLEAQRVSSINRAQIARKLGRKPEQITRWLGAPGNWTLDTISDLLLALGCDPSEMFDDEVGRSRRNYSHDIAQAFSLADALSQEARARTRSVLHADSASASLEFQSSLHSNKKSAVTAMTGNTGAVAAVVAKRQSNATSARGVLTWK